MQWYFLKSHNIELNIKYEAIKKYDKSLLFYYNMDTFNTIQLST